MYELKKTVKAVTSKFVGTGPSFYLGEKKKYLPGRGLTKVEKHWSKQPVVKLNVRMSIHYSSSCKGSEVLRVSTQQQSRVESS